MKARRVFALKTPPTTREDTSMATVHEKTRPAPRGKFDPVVERQLNALAAESAHST
jgi:hypothetical protein